jgi:dolichyl-phosphate-mannose-protein mannosyltransferase
VAPSKSKRNGNRNVIKTSKKPPLTSAPVPTPVDELPLFTTRAIWTAVALFGLGLVFFLINIQFPRTHNFDEFHYVPSAKQFLEMKENQNWEHPPLGKLLMAAGIGIWGDIPIGWRFVSTLFGAATLSGMYVWALLLFGSEPIALWVALLTVSNQLLYVQARIGMLDTFMFGFIVWGLAAFTATWLTRFDLKAQRKLLAVMGLCLGLATACKWFAVVPWLACIGIVALIRVLQHWRAKFDDESPDDWYRPNLWGQISLAEWGIWLGVVPLLAYFFTFIPYFVIQKPSVGFWDLFEMQRRMYDGQLRVVTSHPYMSQWQDWPLLRRPIWYAFDKEGPQSEWVRGVLLLGNPVVMWSGLLALLACAWSWLESKTRSSFLILVFYGAFYISWMLIPRKIAFYYYYYPAGMMLSFALAYVFHYGEHGRSFERIKWARWVFLAAAFGMFVYFFPVLAALRIPSESFRKWMWFRSWI